MVERVFSFKSTNAITDADGCVFESAKKEKLARANRLYPNKRKQP